MSQQTSYSHSQSQVLYKASRGIGKRTREIKTETGTKAGEE